MMAAPFLFLLTRLPGGLALVIVMAVISFGTAAMVHLRRCRSSLTLASIAPCRY